MAILAAKLSSALMKRGIADASIVNEVMADLIRDMGGCAIYVPMRYQDRQSRNQAIKQAWDGHNTRELARQYRLSARRVLQIVRD